MKSPLRQGEYTVAAAKYNAYLKRAPRSEKEYAMALYNLGYCAFSRMDMAQARGSFEKFLAVYPARDRYRADACNRLGDIRYSDREFEAAVAEYDRLRPWAVPKSIMRSTSAP